MQCNGVLQTGITCSTASVKWPASAVLFATSISATDCCRGSSSLLDGDASTGTTSEPLMLATGRLQCTSSGWDQGFTDILQRERLCQTWKPHPLLPELIQRCRQHWRPYVPSCRCLSWLTPVTSCCPWQHRPHRAADLVQQPWPLWWPPILVTQRSCAPCLPLQQIGDSFCRRQGMHNWTPHAEVLLRTRWGKSGQC